MAIEKKQAIVDIFTEEEILEVMSLWKREPSCEFLLPDINATAMHGRHGNNEYNSKTYSSNQTTV